MIRFDQTPPPSPTWDRHMSTESRLMLELRGSIPTVVNRDMGDEQPNPWDKVIGMCAGPEFAYIDELNDGLEVME